MKIETRILEKNDCWKAGRTIRPQGVMVHSIGVAQPDAQVLLRAWNRSGVPMCAHAFVDDKGVYQCLPWNWRGWHAGTGTCGRSANDTHISFECCEPAGHSYRGGTMLGYDIARNQAYFEAVYEQAVQLCAMLCRAYQLDPLADGVLICHSEGHARGIASNHADIHHWWPKHGKTMDDFRRDVKARLEGETMTQEQFDTMLEDYLRRRGQRPPGEWSGEARQWAEAAGLFQGDESGALRYQSFCTREELAAVLQRMGR